jgi:hypothetical protein
MFNFRLSGIAAAAAFAISLTLGISVRGQPLIILLRAFGFGAAFFLLSALVWHLINKYIPELLRLSSPRQDMSPMAGLESGNRVNITLGDGEDPIPPNAALPPEEAVNDGVGNIADAVNRRIPEAAREIPQEAPREAPPDSGTAPLQPAQGMDQSPQSGYTQNRDGVSTAPSPSIQAPAGGFSGLGDVSGDVESLPDLDALAGSFLSPAAGEDSAPAGQSSSPRSTGEAWSKKGKNVGEDFNPKELASAIQTILKRD